MDGRLALSSLSALAVYSLAGMTLGCCLGDTFGLMISLTAEGLLESASETLVATLWTATIPLIMALFLRSGGGVLG